MYVTEVRPREDLAAVAARTGVTVDQLVAVNRLPDTATTSGQALIVPSSRYVVEPGDSLWLIHLRSGLPLDVLRRANPGTERVIYPGRVIRIPDPERLPAEFMGYLPITDPGVTVDSLAPWGRNLTWVAIFSYLVDETGALVPVDDAAAIRATYAAGARPLLCIANMRPGGVFDPEIARAIITDPAVRERVISGVIQAVDARGYAGVDSDIEAVPADLRDGYTDFLRELKIRLGDRTLTAAVPPKWDELTFAYAMGHDYAALGQVLDRAFLMNYEFHWVGGPPGAIAPLPSVRRVLLYATELMPRAKLINGISTTAYDWPLPDTPATLARPWSHDAALQIAIRNQVPIQYDVTAQSPWFRYREADVEREVWFQDARSLLAKIRLIRDLRIRGLGVWHLGAPNSQLITLLDRFFQIRQL